MTHEERKALASRIKWDLIELMSETDGPALDELMGILDAIDLYVQAMEDPPPDAAA